MTRPFRRLLAWWERRRQDRAERRLIRSLDWWHVEQLRADREAERGWE